MVKTAALSIRISPELKELLDQRAAEEGISVAAYAERALQLHATVPAWKLADPEIYFSPARGACVKLPVADGWPVAVLPIEHAKTLGHELVKLTDAGKDLPTRRMTIIEALEAARAGKPEAVTFGYFAPIDGKRVDDPPSIAHAIKKAGSRHMPWGDARSALETLGNMRGAPVTIHTASGSVTLAHDGMGWR